MRAGEADIKNRLDEMRLTLGWEEEVVAVRRGIVERVEGQMRETRVILMGVVEALRTCLGSLRS